MSANGAPVRRVAPAIGLFLLAPLVAEFLLGNLPITFLPGLVMLAPMYGGGALLIRELTRRAGRGVPTMLVLGIAYGLVEEGLTTQSLFNPGYGGGGLLSRRASSRRWASRRRGRCSCSHCTRCGASPCRSC
jgi:hypothetical protein